MNGNSRGSIDTLPSGRKRVRLSLETGRRNLGTFATQDEAERELAAALAVLETDVPVATGALLGEWLDKHLDRRELSGEYRDVEGDRAWFDRHVKSDEIARVPLKALRPHDLDDLVQRLRKKGLARASVLKVLNIVRVGLRQAVRKELIKVNPADDVEVRPDKRTSEPWTYLTHEEQDAVIEGARAAVAASTRSLGIPVDALIEFAMGSGLRAGELVTLRLADVHLDAESPHVVVRYGTAPSLPTKTGRIREVPLFGRALDALQRWLATMPSWAKKNPHKLVFVGGYGEFRNECHVIRWVLWKDILKRAGITRPFRWHDLRHTCASSLVSGTWGRRWSLEEVMGMLGHSDIKVTQRYAHLAPTALKLAARETPSAGHALVTPAGTSNAKPGKNKGAPNTIRTCDLRFRKAEPRSALQRSKCWKPFGLGAEAGRSVGHNCANGVRAA